MGYIILKPYKILHCKITHLLDWDCRPTFVTMTQRFNLLHNTTEGIFHTSLVSFLSK